MATSRYQPADLRRQVGSPRPKGRGSFALPTIESQVQTNTDLDPSQRIKIHYAETYLYMAIVVMKTKAVLSAMTRTRTTPIQICRLTLFIHDCFALFALRVYHAKARYVKTLASPSSLQVTHAGQEHPLLSPPT